MKSSFLSIALPLYVLPNLGAALYQDYYARDAEPLDGDFNHDLGVRDTPFTLDDELHFFVRDSLPQPVNAPTSTSDEVTESMEQLATKIKDALPKVSKDLSKSVNDNKKSKGSSEEDKKKYQGRLKICDFLVSQFKEGSRLHDTVTKIAKRGEAKAFDFSESMTHEWQLLVLETAAAQRGVSKCSNLNPSSKDFDRATDPVFKDLRSLREQLTKEINGHAMEEMNSVLDPNLSSFIGGMV